MILEQAGMQLTPKLFLAQSLAVGLFLGLTGSIYAGWLGLFLVPVGFVVPLAWILARRNLRQRKLCKQLPEAFSMISRAVRSGQTVPAALQIIADDFEAPIASEFALCYEQQNLGMSREAALKKLAGRTGIMELQIFVVAMLVQSRSGGDLVTLLDNLAEMVRKRLKLKNRIRALTGEGRLQAIVLIILPILAFVGMVSLEPDYSRELLDRKWLLAVTAFAQILGAIWIHRIVNFDY
jgi:tight adherence protein B